ncbi:hypothetical protein M231_07546 [Tremella mesenterica]|uniref:Uncharacterized protein n=1 Tax=Tremella mesenterica TaxID=5217 RepID=A0A4Q1B954_TREME|nr:hypothetical protein M231_07546 [Tremella mesenterica]
MKGRKSPSPFYTAPTSPASSAKTSPTPTTASSESQHEPKTVDQLVKDCGQTLDNLKSQTVKFETEILQELNALIEQHQLDIDLTNDHSLQLEGLRSDLQKSFNATNIGLQELSILRKIWQGSLEKTRRLVDPEPYFFQSTASRLTGPWTFVSTFIVELRSINPRRADEMVTVRDSWGKLALEAVEELSSIQKAYAFSGGGHGTKGKLYY